MTMAAKGLTPRQQEIKDLMDRGMTPPEVAKQLGISDNAVYQQLRNMKAGGRRTTARRQSARNAVSAAAPVAGSNSGSTPPAATVDELLAAERKSAEGRLSEIGHERKRLDQERDQLTKRLARLSKAAEALRGRPARPRRSKAASTNGRPSTRAARRAASSAAKGKGAGKGGQSAPAPAAGEPATA